MNSIKNEMEEKYNKVLHFNVLEEHKVISAVIPAAPISISLQETLLNFKKVKQ